MLFKAGGSQTIANTACPNYNITIKLINILRNLLSVSERFSAMKLFLPILLLVVFFSGCAPERKIEYKGKSLRQWEVEAAGKKAVQRRTAAEALGKIGPEGLPTLMKLLDDKNQRVRTTARLAVLHVGGKGAPELRKLLRAPDENVRENATKTLVQALVNMREKGVRRLTKLLENPDPKVRYEAAKGFMRMDQKTARQAIPALKKLSNDKSQSVRNAADLTLKIITP